MWHALNNKLEKQSRKKYDVIKINETNKCFSSPLQFHKIYKTFFMIFFLFLERLFLLFFLAVVYILCIISSTAPHTYLLISSLWNNLLCRSSYIYPILLDINNLYFLPLETTTSLSTSHSVFTWVLSRQFFLAIWWKKIIILWFYFSRFPI